jgi:predicted nucleic acid-binding Zn ribbon protein
MPHAFTPPEHCPVCGEPVPPKAKACPGCGADERTGWNDDEADSSGFDLPDENFDREKFLETEFGVQRKKTTREKLWLGAAIVVLAAMILLFVFRNILLHG